MKNRIKEVEKKMNGVLAICKAKASILGEKRKKKIIAENFRNYLETTCRFKLLNNPQIGKTQKSPTGPSDLPLQAKEKEKL